MADEQVRQVQEALHKRHLFYGNPTGEMSPALSAAIAWYQEKKGFPSTGSIDLETCASLGIVRLVSYPSQTPFVVENNGTVRGANGEPLPVWPLGESPARFGSTDIEDDDVAEGPAASDTELKNAPGSHSKAAPPRTRARPRPQKETNPILLAFRSVENGVKYIFGDRDPKKKRPTKRL